MRLRTVPLRLLLASAIAIGACSTPVSPPATVGTDLATYPQRVGLLIENPSDRRTWYVLVPLRNLPLFDLAACVDVVGCASIAPYFSVTAPWPAVPASEREFRLFWWRSVNDGHGGQKADSIRTSTVMR